MRIPMTFAVVTLLMVGAIGPAPAHLGDRIYPILEISDEDLALIDVTDGSVEDV